MYQYTPIEYNRILNTYDSVLKSVELKMKELEKGNKNGVGLLKNEVKNNPEYKDLKKQFNLIFGRRKRFCASVPKKIKQEASQLRRAEKIKRNPKN